MNKFKVGDRVRMIHLNYQNDLGTVVSFDSFGDPWVEWDDTGRCDIYRDHVLILCERGGYGDFEDKIKDRITGSHSIVQQT